MKFFPKILFFFFVLISISNFSLLIANAASDYQPLAPIPGFVDSPISTHDLNGYLNGMFKLGIAIAVGLAVVMIIIGGVQYMSTDAIGGKSDGRARITAAITGLVVALGSYMLLNTLDPNLLKTELTLQSVTGGTVGGPTLHPGDVGYPYTPRDPQYGQPVSPGDPHYPNPPPTTPPPSSTSTPPTTPPNTQPPGSTEQCTRPPNSTQNPGIAIIGDSITEDGARNIENALEAKGYNPFVNGLMNRNVNQGLGIVNDPNFENDLRSTNSYIIELGTNQTPNFGTNAQALVDRIHAVNPNAQVYWTEIFSTDPAHASEYAAENDAIRHLNGVTVIPTRDANIPTADHTHPTTAGYNQLANIMANPLPNCSH
jgi:hypothetical protein